MAAMEQMERRTAARWTAEEDERLKQLVRENPSSTMREIAEKATAEMSRAVPGVLRRLRALRDQDPEMQKFLPGNARRRTGRGGGRAKAASAEELPGYVRSMIQAYLGGEAAVEVEQQLSAVFRRYGELRSVHALSEVLIELPTILASEIKRRIR